MSLRSREGCDGSSIRAPRSKRKSGQRSSSTTFPDLDSFRRRGGADRREEGGVLMQGPHLPLGPDPSMMEDGDRLVVNLDLQEARRPEAGGISQEGCPGVEAELIRQARGLERPGGMDVSATIEVRAEGGKPTGHLHVVGHLFSASARRRDLVGHRQGSGWRQSAVLAASSGRRPGPGPDRAGPRASGLGPRCAPGWRQGRGSPSLGRGAGARGRPRRARKHRNTSRTAGNGPNHPCSDRDYRGSR